MKALGLYKHGGPEVLAVLELDKPEPGDHQVLIRVQGVSVNYADLQARRGSYHAGVTVMPVIPGLDAMGIVEAVGSAVTSISPGQRVIAFPHTGSYAEYVVADENLVFPVPEALSFEQAAACPLVSFTAYMILAKVARLQRGEHILVHAASGGIGTTAIQMAKAMGAGQVIGTVGHQHKAEVALKAGADIVVCHQEEDYLPVVNCSTGDRGADVILDSLGGPFTGRNLACLGSYGRLVAFGNATGDYHQVDTGLLHGSCRSVLGFSIGTTRKLRPAWFGEVAGEIFAMMTEGKLKIQVSHLLNLSEAAKAHAMIEAGEVTGKIILAVAR